MENASKALLIAAAVLIVILLVAFSMKIFQSTNGKTANDAGTIGSTISNQMESAASSIVYPDMDVSGNSGESGFSGSSGLTPIDVEPIKPGTPITPVKPGDVAM